MPEHRDQHVHYTRKEWSEEPYFCEVVEYLKQKNIKSFLDIGSNVGEVANVLSDQINTLVYFYLIEPQKDNFAFLKDNTKQLKNCTYFNFGIFYGKREAELYQDPSWKNVGAYTVEVLQNQFCSIGETIKLCTLEECNIPVVDFAKIDVEGAEYNIIENSEYLKSVPYIDIEFHNWNIKHIEFMHKNLPTHKVGISTGNHLFMEKI